MSGQELTVVLPSTTVYVTGTVNGETTVWTNTEGDVWQTVAPKAPSGRYQIELTLYQSSGLVLTASLEAALYFEPVMVNAWFTVNPVYEYHSTTLLVYAGDYAVEPTPQEIDSGQYMSGEV